MFITFRLSRATLCVVLCFSILLGGRWSATKWADTDAAGRGTPDTSETESIKAEKNYIKWVDFNITADAMNSAMKLDIETHNTKTPLNWIELLSVLERYCRQN